MVLQCISKERSLEKVMPRSFTEEIWKILRSSANRHLLMLSGIMDVISFMYIKNKMGPNMDPWGTPE
uniref:Uncharacterized protein n=1 Tax=Meloidogyne incognita TaxID=6306 RepID=A0A914NAX5_MELIC